LLEPQARRLLHELAGRQGVHVGVMSGRSLADLKHLVALPYVHYIGNSGLELDLGGKRAVHPKAEQYRSLVAKIVGGLSELANRHPGSWVEDKGLGLTLHYRNVPLRQLKDLLEQAGRLLHPHSNVLRVVDAPMAWEVTPALDWDKGTALRQIVKLAGDTAIPLYAGDRANDAPALEAAHALGGVSIGVGSDAPSCVQHRLREPAELLSFLGELSETLVSCGSIPTVPVSAGPTAAPAVRSEAHLACLATTSIG
jgi:trehalose-phosphatase